MTRDCLNLKYDDTIQCSFFSSNHLTSIEWDQLCDEINKTVDQLSIDYIWHRDKFCVYFPVLDKNNEVPARLVSTTCFGDNIEDEWFIVYLILEITKEFNHLIVQLEDNDGDFVLIEAAEYLPSWANPDTTVNRVFIHNHHVHIIPPALTTDLSVKISDAINLVAQNPDITKASLDIQNVILKRIGIFPQKIYDNFHKVILKLPLEIATILTLEPSLISPIVSTYCNLDALEARHCTDTIFDDCVNVEVKFTKYLYAMLLHSPLLSTIKYKVAPSDKRGQLGLKLASGYNVIMKQSSKDPLSTIEYQRFLENLTKNGYFKKNMEGSIHYKQLLEKANFYFLNMESPVNSHLCSVINGLKSSNKSVETNKAIKSNSDSGKLKEDDDKWLTIHPDELNHLLNNQYGKKVVKNETVTPHLITSKLSSFLKKSSDFEGIEQTRNEDTEDGSIEFDSKDFVSCIQKMLNLVTNKNELDIEDCSDISEEDCSDSENLAQDLELACKLKSINGESAKDDKNIFNNFVQSMKEEGVSGPSSVVLRTIGVNKTDILDSDDDDE